MVESLSGLPDQLNASQRSSRCRTFSPRIERKDGHGKFFLLAASALILGLVI
jgi:hypothetical protein